MNIVTVICRQLTDVLTLILISKERSYKELHRPGANLEVGVTTVVQSTISTIISDVMRKGVQYAEDKQ